jgi:transposase
MKNTNIEIYYELFYRWQHSGLSKAAFAHKEGISKMTFYHWCKKFERKTEAQDSQPGFSRIELADATSQDLVARINFPNGISLDLFGSFDAQEIKILLF